LKALKSGDEALLAVMFAHLERMASSTDSHLINVAFQSVLESLSGWLVDHPRSIDPMMGPETRRLLAWKPGDPPFLLKDW
jgi:hypothetical protein